MIRPPGGQHMIQREDASKTIPAISSDRPSTLAESDLRIRLRTFPRDAHTWCTLGSYLRSMGRFEEAEEALRKAISLNPGPAHFQEELARILMAVGRLDEAYQLLDIRGNGSIAFLRDEINAFRDIESSINEEVDAISPCIACQDYSYYGCSKGGACDSIIQWRARIRELAVPRPIR
jgi:tetratricopeptide (TPR) repeat protein